MSTGRIPNQRHTAGTRLDAVQRYVRRDDAQHGAVVVDPWNLELWKCAQRRVAKDFRVAAAQMFAGRHQDAAGAGSGGRR